MFYVLICILHCVDVLFDCLNEGQVFMATEFVNGRLDVLHQVFKILNFTLAKPTYISCRVLLLSLAPDSLKPFDLVIDVKGC